MQIIAIMLPNDRFKGQFAREGIHLEDRVLIDRPALLLMGCYKTRLICPVGAGRLPSYMRSKRLINTNDFLQLGYLVKVA